MIVVDAAVIVDFLIDASATGEAVRDRLARERWPWAAPELMDAEVAHVVRRHVLRGELAAAAAEAALADLVTMRIERHSHCRWCSARSSCATMPRSTMPFI